MAEPNGAVDAPDPIELAKALERCELFIAVSREVNGVREHRKLGIPKRVERQGEDAVNAFVAAMTPAQWDAAEVLPEHFFATPEPVVTAPVVVAPSDTPEE